MMNLLSVNESQLPQTDPRDAFLSHHRAMHNLSVINWQWSATRRSNTVDSTCDDRRALVKFFRTREVSLFRRYEISLKFKVGQIKKAFVVKTARTAQPFS